jgi:hypothetical protein
VLTDGGGGVYTTFASPFAAPKGCSIQTMRLPLVYCDQTASNRPVRSIERYMENVCLPLYGNTHTTTSVTGSQRYVLIQRFTSDESRADH